MNLLKKQLIRRDAQMHANRGVFAIDDEIVAAQGPRPNPENNVEYAEHVRVLNERGVVEDLRGDIGRLEAAIPDHSSPAFYTFCLAVFGGVETFGVVSVLDSLGVSERLRLGLGAGIAFALIGATAVVARRTAGSVMPTGTAGPLAERVVGVVKRSVGTTFALIGYGLLVAAIAMVRLLDAAGEGESPITMLPGAALMVAATVAPAWIIESIARKRAPARALHHQLKVLRRDLRRAERAHARAQAGVNGFLRAVSDWDDGAARHRALYQTVHRLEQARSQHELEAEKGPTRTRSKA